MSGTKKNSLSDSKKSMPDHIRALWDDFYTWLAKIPFGRPTTTAEILPQFYADKIMKNIRLAAIFSIDVVKLQEMTYEERITNWCENLLHHFGDSISELHYRAWQTNISPNSLFISSNSTTGTKIGARLFFHDVHMMAGNWGELGVQFLRDLFFQTWEMLSCNLIDVYTTKEEKSNSAPYESAYAHEVNHALKEENLRRSEVHTYTPETHVFNKLSSNFGVSLASKKNRDKFKREFVNYAWHVSFTNVAAMITRSPPKEKVDDQQTSKRSRHEDITPHSPSSSELKPESTPQKDEMKVNELSGEAHPDGNEQKLTPLPFPPLSPKQDRASLIKELLGDPAFISQIFEQHKKQQPLDDLREDGEIPDNSRSPSKSKSLRPESIIDVTSSLNTMLSQTKYDIRLKELSEKDIQSWGDIVEQYESKHGPWDRSKIDRTLRNRINQRWTLDAYQALLPTELSEQPHLIVENSWMKHDVISTVELVRFLKRSCSVGRGSANLNAGFDEMLDLVNNYNLPMRKSNIAKGVEDFLLRVDELKETNEDIFSSQQEKDLSKAVHNLVSRGRCDRYDDPVLDIAVGRAITDAMRDDTKTSFAKTLTLLRNGLSKAITDIIGNSLFDNLGSGRESRGRTKFSSSSSSSSSSSYPQRGSDTPEKKKARVTDTDNPSKTSPVCDGCGRWLSDKHTHQSCEYIKKRLPGYNKEWETVKWAESNAHKTLKEKLLKVNPQREGPYFLPPPPGHTKGIVCCNTLSYPNPDSLPLIQGVLEAKPTTDEEVEEEAAIATATVIATAIAGGSRPTMDLPREKDNDNIETSHRLLNNNSITIFVDTGSGDNFISTQYAESLINFGYKPIFSETICEVCSPFKEKCVPCGHTYSINLSIKDDIGDIIKLNVVAKTLPIKHNLILGLKDIRENNLMWRFPGVFLSKDFTGYLEGNLLWSYLRAMFKEHLSRVNRERLRVSNGEDRRLDRTAEQWDSLCYATVELAASDSPLRKFEDSIDSSPDPEQSSEHSSKHPLPHGNSQSESSLQKEVESQRSHKGPVAKKKRVSSSIEEKGRRAQSAKRGNSGRKAHSGDGSLHSSKLRWETRRRTGVKLRKVQIRHLCALAKGEAPPKTNFSAISPFEAEGLTDLRDNDLEAIPTEMLRAIDPGAPPERPDLQHLDDLQSKNLYRDLCEEYGDLFRATVSSTEAHVKPFSLRVDQQSWETRGNRSPPRRLDNTREAELRKQIDLLLRLGVIRESRAGFYSHAFVVPKPGKKWRLVLDFKPLNKVSEVESGWGIPNIQDIMRRLGGHRPKYFAVMDLTAGFHQTPIDEESRKYTAFKTSWGGVYEWCRLPMGLKGAPAYFQSAMATEVLGGLVMNICEIYLDDVIVFADTQLSLVQRLKQCFERFREKGISLNPSKCKLGVTSVEYCGHLIDKDGLHFTQPKLETVADFPTPETQHQLRSFLGLANWFRDHIRDHSSLVRPLHKVLDGYDKKKRLIWTPELLQSFADTKKAISGCPKLYFLDDVSPIYLHTDASQYGMGAYLFQVRDGISYPIRFLSKAFDDRMSRWSTIQQEGYAIYYAITQWDYLLRDRKFTLRTDHDNLTMLKVDSNVKVQRWMLALQAFDYEVEHIKGINNIVADGLSRLCPDERKPLGMTKSPNSLTEAGSSKKSNEDILELDRDVGVKESALELCNLETIVQMSLPRLLIVQRISMYTKYTEQIELWNLSVLAIQPLSDTEINDRINVSHNDLVGHHGVNRTMELVKSSPRIKQALQSQGAVVLRLRQKVRKFIRSCPCCQKMNMDKIRSKAKPFTLSTFHPMQTLMIDYIESLPQDDLGFQHIAVVVDCFSRYCTLHATRTTKASELARALTCHVSIFGVPDDLVTDKGPAFTSEVFKDLMLLLGIAHQKTLTGSKEEAGIVERLNKEVMRHLRNLIFDRRVYKTWSQSLPLVQRIINTMPHTATGISPADIITPCLNLQRRILIDQELEVYEAVQQSCTFPEYINEMLNRQAYLIEKAQANLKSRDAKHLERKSLEYDEELTRFPIGSYVLAEKLNFFTIRKETDKLKPYLKGPFRVESFSEDFSQYTVRNLVTNNIRTYHVKKLKAFQARPEDTDLTKYAVRDDNFWIVKSVKDFRPKNFDASTSRKSLEFKVEWEIDESQTWEPWSYVRNLQALRDYVHSASCKNKVLKKLVPTNIVEEEEESDEEFFQEQDAPYWN